MQGHTNTPPLLLRRNGRPQACDPCRKRKLACDHTQPVCSRCKKRKQDAECVYIISDPKLSGAKSSLPSPTSSRRASSIRHESRRGSPQSENVSVVTPSGKVPSLNRPGYLGPTSYCNIYEATENSLSMLQRSDADTPQSDQTTQYVPVEGTKTILSPRIRDMCLTVLRNIPDISLGKSLRFKVGSDGWIRPVVLRANIALYGEFGEYFSSADRPEARLEELARLFCDNTSQPVSDDETDPEKWMSQFMGRNMRWELIGALSVFWDFVPGARVELWKGVRSAKYAQSFRTARENMRLCLEISKEFSSGNFLMLYLSQRCTVVDSMSVGDANLLTWRSHAESVSLLTFLGFHALEEKDPSQATLSTEIKKRAFQHMFSMSMVIVSFTGRPPLLSSRYSSTPLPLDISDEDLFSDPETLKRAVERLDEKGWNTDGLIFPSTTIRGRAIIAKIREEIFQIALGNEQAVSIETLLQLRARELQEYSEFPSSIQFEPYDLRDPHITTLQLSSRLFLRLEHLQNMFFIERLLVRCGHRDNGDLLKVSYDLVTLTLPCMLHYYLDLDKFAPFRNDCEWIVMAYAVPSGGILCLELLKPTLHLRPHSDARITRSNIIQKLSLLVAFLDWVSPIGANGDLCGDARSVIARVLDHALNAAPSVQEPPMTLEWDFSTQLDFSFDLLDTFDWNRPDFPSSQQSNQLND